MKGSAGSTRGSLAAALTVACAGLAFHRVFAWRDVLTTVCVAAVVPPLVLQIALRRPRSHAPYGSAPPLPPLWFTLIVVAAAWVPGGSTVVFHRPPTFGVLGREVSALRDGWRTLLDTVLPAPGRPELLILLFTATWCASMAAGELAARTRGSAAPLLPAICLFLLGIFLGSGSPGSILPDAAGLTAACAATMALRGRAERGIPVVGAGGTGLRSRRHSWAEIGVQALAVTVAAGVAWAAAPHLPLVAGRAPYDPKRAVSLPPPTVRRAVSPLDEMSAWLGEPDRELFAVRTSHPRLWRLAVFDRFDGATWSSSARWEPTGGRVPGDPQAGAAAGSGAGDADQITISGLTGPWLPAADRPQYVSGMEVSVDPASGVVVASQLPRPGQTYSVRSDVPAPDENQLRQAAVADDASALADAALPTVDAFGQPLAAYQNLQQVAQQATVGTSYPFQQAVLLQRYLSTHEGYDGNAGIGYNYSALQRFVGDTHAGTSVQAAAAFVVMARSLGLPSRLVVGFDPGTARDGLWHVTAGDAEAWAEVDFKGIGWVPFRPAPAHGSAATPPSPATGGGDDRTKIDDDVAAAASKPLPTPAPLAAPPAAASRAQARGTSQWPYPAGAIAGAFGLCFAVLMTAPARRRRRRFRAKDPKARIAGAWRQAVDTLPPTSVTRRERAGTSPLTTAEFADAALSVLAPEAHPHLSALAMLVDAVEYAAVPPGQEAGDTAWRHCAALEDVTARSMGSGRRWRRRLSAPIREVDRLCRR